ncbi:hypothetical protein SERLADRAFT_447019 [Serpula lacrymans var. lacrymans S7.9]|uniref:Putative phospholipase n=1 Tax=Serpula lacrymans var. lacrymans (strain S7.9) TaxID=578457 RepID=F8NM14_SERL9|nr:uncharacterized protein SERLADRAFT_447019 [Serpula lacrymans var. lacrymans S7.9]EGO27802.1 hypothetical protein SERLADRAFT_447019 [Serpula lacrymans var. lacrymans S7.9]
MLYFPSIKGRYPVGATTFQLAVPSPITVGTSKIRAGGQNGDLKSALVVEEIAFTAYYPAQVRNIKRTRGLDWLIRPIRESLRGYAHFAGISTWIVRPLVYLYGSFLRVPVHENAPLLSPVLVSEDAEPPKPNQNSWPLVIFSHGLGGSRTTYSQLCMRLASSGRVVLAMEHRDGSGHVCVPSRSPAKLYIKESDIIWSPDTKDEERTMLSFRGDQLTFRQHEIYLAYAAFSKLVKYGYEGPGNGLQLTDASKIDWDSWTQKDDVVPIQCDDNIALAGHSFGGATVFSILSTDPPSSESTPIPVNKALILDPWIEPICSPGPSPVPSPRDRPLPRLLVINSEGFTLWKDHFERLVGVVGVWEPAGRRLLTIVRSKHISFSDFPLLPLTIKKKAHIVMDIISKLSLAFLDGSIDNALDDIRTRKMEIKIVGIKKDGRPSRQLVGDIGDVIVH